MFLYKVNWQNEIEKIKGNLFVNRVSFKVFFLFGTSIESESGRQRKNKIAAFA